MTLTQPRPTDPRPAQVGRARLSLPATAAGAVALLGAAVVVSVLVGSTAVPLDSLLDPDAAEHAVAAARLARTCVALVAGAALGLAGACLQGLTRNPLADPGILGLNAGASFAMIAGDRLPRALRPLGLPLVRLRRRCARRAAVHGVACGRPGRRHAGQARGHRSSRHGRAHQLDLRGAAHRPGDDGDLPVLGGRHGGRPGVRRAAPGPALPRPRRGARPGRAAGRSTPSPSATTWPAGSGRHPARDRALVGRRRWCCSPAAATALAGPIAFVGLVVPHAARTWSRPGAPPAPAAERGVRRGAGRRSPTPPAGSCCRRPRSRSGS